MNYPFLDESHAIRWDLLTAENVEPDMREALRRANEQIETIRSLPPEQADYSNTIEALAAALDGVSRPWRKVTNLTETCDSGPLREAYRTVNGPVSSFFSSIYLDTAIWETVQAAARNTPEGSLSAPQARLLKETIRDFQDSGADLPQEQRRRLLAIEERLTDLCRDFSERVLDSMNAFEWVTADPAELAGLPPREIEAARQRALEKGHGTDESPRYRLTLQMPSFRPAMRYLEDRQLRETLYCAYFNVAREDPHQTGDIVREILSLRHEKARILNKENWVDLVTARRMAKSGSQARHFVEDLHQRVLPAFQRECQARTDFAAEHGAQPPQSLEPWDIAYWDERMRQQQLDFDEETVRPYLEMDKVLQGLFQIVSTLFGIRVSELCGDQKPPVWHPEVRYYDVHDIDGRHLGSFYTDWHPRETKRSGAWMATLLTGEPDPQTIHQPHLGLITGNMTSPVPGQPTFLSLDEVRTIFHEFGHLLHQILGDVPVKALNGCNQAWDFIELPSQILENWCRSRESLDLFARHHQTGETIPDELFQKIRASERFGAACATMRQLSFAILDLGLHMDWHRDTSCPPDVLDLEISRPYRIPTPSGGSSMVYMFGHLFSDPVGYAGGYYSYKWAEVLEADAFTRFLNEGVLNPQTGRELRDKIFAAGNSAPPEVLFRNFMGRDPDPEALLRRDGLL